MQQSIAINTNHAVDAIQKGGVLVGKLITESLPDQKMYIAPWLAQNTISLVASQRGVGKSWFLHILAAMLTHQTEALCLKPWVVKEQANVLLIDGELSEHDLQRRFKSLIEWEPPDNNLMVLSKNRQHRLKLPTPNLANEKWRECIYNFVLANNYDVVMFDNMSCLAPGLDELRKQDWDPVVAFFLALRFAGKTVLFAHHLGKQGGSGPRGTSSLEDPVDYSIKLEKVGKDHGTEAKFKVKFTKARHLLGDSGADIEISLQNHDNDSVGCVTSTIQPTQGKPSKVKDIIANLIASPMLSQAVISEKLSVSPQHISKVKKEAMSEGYLEESDGQRILTSKGREVYGDI